MDEPNIPWIYVAMVAIIFLRWLFTQFKKAATIRQDMREQQRRGRRQPPPTIQRQQSAPSCGEVESQPQPPRTLQELFEQKRQEIIEAQRQIENERERELEEERARSVPPPLPSRPEPEVEREPVTSPIGETGIGGLGSVRPITALVEPRRGRNDISQLLSDSTSLRNAIILKEVLDSPKGLQD